MAKGDHIYVRHTHLGVPFQHHGIDMGDGTVIHLAPTDGPRVALRDSSAKFKVRRVSLEDFQGDHELHQVAHSDALDPEQVVINAEHHLGQTGYHLFESNCEHFATLCATGRWESRQIEMSQAAVTALTSMGTKTLWALSSKLGSRVALRSAIKVHPAAILADGVEIATLAASCRGGASAETAQRYAKWSGTLAAAGIGGVIGGPAGAAVGLAAHSSSTAIADRLCRTVRRLLS